MLYFWTQLKAGTEIILYLQILYDSFIGSNQNPVNGSYFEETCYFFPCMYDF